jgi:hypothetical protein
MTSGGALLRRALLSSAVLMLASMALSSKSLPQSLDARRLEIVGSLQSRRTARGV